MEKDCSNNEKIKKVLFNEFTFIIAMISVVSGFIFWITNPQQDMQLQLVRLESQLESNRTIVSELEKIKNNDFVELHKAIEQMEARQIEILQALAVLEHELNVKN